jgi:hypothetical protein
LPVTKQRRKARQTRSGKKRRYGFRMKARRAKKRQEGKGTAEFELLQSKEGRPGKQEKAEFRPKQSKEGRPGRQEKAEEEPLRIYDEG